MKHKRWNRRRFLRFGLSTVAGGWMLPRIVARRALASPGRPGANDALRIGLVGCGIRGKYLVGNLPPEGRVVAICDCYTPRMTGTLKPEPSSTYARVLKDFVQQDAGGCTMYQDYRQMLDEAALDAVMIATCDHHHVLAAMLACQAGLDVYCEKPLSLTIDEGKKLVAAVRRYGRVLQVGSQQRSMEMDRFGCQFVREGRLGRVSHVDVPIWASPLKYQGLPSEAVPDGMDWDLFCGPTELRAYNWRLWQKDERKWEGKNWRGWDMWRDYSGHLVTNWGAHAVDIVQWALGMDGSGPVEVGPLPAEDRVDSRVCPMVARYANGIELRMNGAKGVGGGGIFYGEHGSIAVDRNRFRADPPDLITDPPDPSLSEIWKGAGIVARPHIQNWIDCIKSRSEPNAPVEVGHRTVTICHLFNIARELCRQIKWDPIRELIVGDDEASALLDRPRRVGWELPSDDTCGKAGSDK